MLNDEQQRAVEAVRGPVCILAGAGSGKTTTITHRVANQVLSGAFRPDEILAVTFTDKAAGEMRGRLDELGVGGVRCSTFHSAALGQLRFFAPEPPGKIMASKALPLRYIGNTLRRPYRAFTVDEYQDVNLLQQTLLDRWLGERDELCAVGDDYQSIYAFTGASPEYLLAMPERFPDATVVRLEDNYRSTPEVLEVANR